MYNYRTTPVRSTTFGLIRTSPRTSTLSIVRIPVALLACLGLFFLLTSFATAQSVSPTSLSFGNEAVGTTSAAKTITVKNGRKVAVSIASITIDLPEYGENNNCPITPATLAPGATCTISVTFAPTATGAQHGTLTIVDTTTQKVPLNGTGIVAVVATPSSLTFANTIIGHKSAAKPVTVKNNEPTALTINSITSSLPDYLIATDTCPLSPATLAAGTSCKITVTFSPTALGLREGTLTISDDASNSPTIPLSGTGELAVAVAPSGLTFSGQALGTISPTQTVTLVNNQAAQLTIGHITSSLSDFALTSSCPSKLAAGASCSVAVAFAPAATGTRTATLTFVDNATNSPQTVSLVGTGLPAALVAISVTPVNPSFALGTTQQFDATGTYSDKTTQDLTGTATWSTGNSNIATIGAGGLATSVSSGSTTVTAASGSISGSTTLNVTPAALVSIVVTPVDPSFVLGTTQQFIATGTYTDNTTQDLSGTATWSTGNSNIARISVGGLATSVSAGSTTVTAASGSISGSTNLNISPAALVSIAVTPVDPSFALGTTQQFTATGTYTDKTTKDLTATATWSSANSSIATIATDGLAMSVATGTTTVTAASGSISGSTTLNVTSATLISINVTPADPSFALGTTQQFTATGTYTDKTTQDLSSTATWSTGNPAVATIAAGGLATSVSSGSATVTAASGSINGSTTLNVTPAALVSIAVTPANPSITVGSTQQFTATGTYTDNTQENLTTTSSWSSTNLSIATISSSGLATTVASGGTTITAQSGAITGSTSLVVTPPTTILSRIPERVCLMESETASSLACSLPASIPAGDGVLAFVTSTTPQTLAPGTVQDSKGNTYSILGDPAAGGFATIYSVYSRLGTALQSGDVITVSVSSPDSWGVSIYDMGPVEDSQADVGVTFQNQNVGQPDEINPDTNLPGWWTGQTPATTGSNDMCISAMGVGSANYPGNSGDGTPAPITLFTADNNFTRLDITQTFAQSDLNYANGGTLLTMYSEVPAGSTVQSHVISNDGVSNTAPAALYCFKEAAGPVKSVPWFTGNYCTGTVSCTINNVVPGHMLVIGSHSYVSLPPSPIVVTDSQPEVITFTQLAASVGLGSWEISPVANAGSHTITVDDSVDPEIGMVVAEIAGQASGNPVEAVAQNGILESSAATVSITTQTPDDLIYAWGRSYFGSDEGQGFTAVQVFPTVEYAAAPDTGPQTVNLRPRGTPPWDQTGIQAMAIRPAGTVAPPVLSPSFTGNYCIGRYPDTTCTLNNVAPGDILVMSSLAGGSLSQPPTITDTMGETIVVDRGNDSDGSITLSTWHIGPVINAGTHTFNIDGSVFLIVTEYTSQSPTRPIDALTAVTANTGGFGSATVQTTQGNDLLYVFCATDSPSGWGDGFAAFTTSPTSEYRMAGPNPGPETATCPSSPNDPSAGWIMQELAIRH